MKSVIYPSKSDKNIIEKNKLLNRKDSHRSDTPKSRKEISPNNKII